MIGAILFWGGGGGLGVVKGGGESNQAQCNYYNYTDALNKFCLNVKLIGKPRTRLDVSMIYM